MEIKLRLPNKEAHDAVAAQLKDSFRETHQQENFFFDGVKGELSSQRVVLRCRFYNKDKRAIVTLKVLVCGWVCAMYGSNPAVPAILACACPGSDAAEAWPQKNLLHLREVQSHVGSDGGKYKPSGAPYPSYLQVSGLLFRPLLFVEQHESSCRAARSSRRGWAEGRRWRMTSTLWLRGSF